MEQELGPENTTSLVLFGTILVLAMGAAAVVLLAIAMGVHFFVLQGARLWGVPQMASTVPLAIAALLLLGLFVARWLILKASREAVRAHLGAEGEKRVEAFLSNRPDATLPEKIARIYLTPHFTVGTLFLVYIFNASGALVAVGEPLILIPIATAIVGLFSLTPTRATFESWLRASVSTRDQF